jgi:hypothetical protein
MTPTEQIELAERIVRVETKLDFLIAQLEKLPPSPTCVTRHSDFEHRILSLEAWRNKAIGALLILNIVFIVAIDKIKAWIWPGP